MLCPLLCNAVTRHHWLNFRFASALARFLLNWRHAIELTTCRRKEVANSLIVVKKPGC